jgi:hypothetical protein
MTMVRAPSVSEMAVDARGYRRFLFLLDLALLLHLQVLRRHWLPTCLVFSWAASRVRPAVSRGPECRRRRFASDPSRPDRIFQSAARGDNAFSDRRCLGCAVQSKTAVPAPNPRFTPPSAPRRRPSRPSASRGMPVGRLATPVTSPWSQFKGAGHDRLVFRVSYGLGIGAQRDNDLKSKTRRLEEDQAQKTDRIAAPTARRVNTVQVRSGHLGSDSGSGSGSGIGFPAFVLGLTNKDTTDIARWMQTLEPYARPLPSANASHFPKRSDGLHGKRGPQAWSLCLRSVTIFAVSGALQPQDDGRGALAFG